jgi:hypothetical protein
VIETDIELSLPWRAGGVQGNHLRPEQVLAIWNAFGNVNSVKATVCNNLARSPDAIRIPVFLDLEPAAANFSTLQDA